MNRSNLGPRTRLRVARTTLNRHALPDYGLALNTSRMVLSRVIGLAACGAIAVGLNVAASATQEENESRASRRDSIAFETHIRPLLKQHCFHCHGERGVREGGLDTRLQRLLVEGGDSGAAIEPGDASASYLIHRVEIGEMPPEVGKQLSADEVQLLRDWINGGAITLRDEPAELSDGFVITEEDREFWSFQPIARPTPPSVDGVDRVSTDIDRFVLAKLERQGLTFAPDADKRTLIGRVSADLRGLPPTVEEIDHYLRDESAHAYSAMVDRMLQSPQYGEHWGRHWLDVAGYADSEGTENDQDRPWAFRYRDYVIRALNDNMPLDQFILEQLAGDESVAKPWEDLAEDQVEKIAATGFLRMAADGTAQVNSLEQRNQTIADTIEIVSTSLLGMSVQCARCHDHRYDPISQADYYRLRAVFEPSMNPSDWKTPSQRLVSLYTTADRQQAASIEAQVQEVLAAKSQKQAEFMAAALDQELAKYEEPLRQQLRDAYQTEAGSRSDAQQSLLKQYPAVNITPGVLYQYNQKAADELKQFDTQVADLRKQKPIEPFIRACWEASKQVPVTHVLHRGDPQQPKESVEPRGLTITRSEDQFQIDANVAAGSTGRRTALARWLCHPAHPLTSRVLANRIWMNHFGKGIVGTPADFGRLGDRPTHPELLDWLATELRENRWDLKAMHRLIMNSTVYRQASSPVGASAPLTVNASESFATAAEVDPQNQLYWKWPLQRLTAESLRDAWLQVSGKLDPAMFGAPVDLRQDETGQTLVAKDHHRRSLYVKVKRSQPVAMLQLFDQPVMVTNCPRRTDSSAAPQALAMMNSPWIQDAAREMVRNAANPTLTMDEHDWLTELMDQEAAIAGLEYKSPWSVGWGTVADDFDSVEAFTPFTFQHNDHMQVTRELPDPNSGWVFLSPGGGHPGNGLDHVAIRRWLAPASGTVSVHGKLTHGSEQGDGVRATAILMKSSEFGSALDDRGVEEKPASDTAKRSSKLAQWNAFHEEQLTTVEAIEVRAGDVIDFVVDAKTNEGFDSFGWAFEITLRNLAEDGKNSNATWSSTDASIVTPTAPVAIQLRRLWPMILQRPATDEEMEWGMAFVVEQTRRLGMAAQGTQPEQIRQALAHVAQALMTSNEFLYIE